MVIQLAIEESWVWFIISIFHPQVMSFSFEVKRKKWRVAHWRPVLNIWSPTPDFWSHWRPLSRNFEPCDLALQIQCSSDISEHRIRVLYVRILRIRVCQYAHIRAYIRAYMCVYTRVYVSLLFMPTSFIVGQTEQASGFNVKFAY